VLTMQDALARLDGYWTGRGCLRVQPMSGPQARAG
jgi:glycyl-tRNA synthetase alpha subunit